MRADRKSILLIGLFVTEQNKHRILRSSSDRLAELYQKHGIPVIKASGKVGRLPRLFDTLSIIFRNRKHFDIAVVPIFGGLSLVLEAIITRALRLLNKKIVLVIRGGAIPEKMKTQAAYYLPVLNRADVVISPSGFTQYELGQYGVQCRLIENVINLGDYHFNEKKSFRPRLFWMRTFEDVYNPEMAVRVVALLARKFPDTRMVMAGHDMGLLQKVKDLSVSLGVQDRIEFFGYIFNDDKNRFAREYDFYICTNTVDNAPVSLTEVMAMGMPIVTTNAGGIPYLVKDRDTALMVNINDDDAMACAVEEVVNNSSLGQQLVQNGYAYSRIFGEAPVMDKWKSLFGELGYQDK